MSKQKYNSQLPVGERVASLEKQADRTEDDVKALTEKVDEKLEKLTDELSELSESQSIQTHKLGHIESQIRDVQGTVSGIEGKMVATVTGLIKVARNTEQLDKSLKEDLTLFSKERMDNYKKIGGILAAIVALIYGFLTTIGFGNVFNKPVKQETVDRLQGK